MYQRSFTSILTVIPMSLSKLRTRRWKCIQGICGLHETKADTMLIISRDKIFHHIHIVRVSTFLAGIVRLKAKVVIIYTFDIKPFANSISHWDRREDWKDDVVYTLPFPCPLFGPVRRTFRLLWLGQSAACCFCTSLCRAAKFPSLNFSRTKLVLVLTLLHPASSLARELIWARCSFSQFFSTVRPSDY